MARVQTKSFAMSTCLWNLKYIPNGFLNERELMNFAKQKWFVGGFLQFTWMPLLKLAACRQLVMCRLTKSSVASRCRTAPSILAATKASLCCGRPTSSSHRSTHPESREAAFERSWMSGGDGFELPTAAIDNCSFFRWKAFCKSNKL